MQVLSRQPVLLLTTRPSCVEPQLGCRYNLAGHCCHGARASTSCPLTLEEQSSARLLHERNDALALFLRANQMPHKERPAFPSSMPTKRFQPAQQADLRGVSK
jgi:hypothetical protein